MTLTRGGRDGHGNNSAAGLLSRQSFAKAGDAAAFPDQIAGDQRGSKFWASWDFHTPVLATWGRGQAPRRGGWLQASYGKGQYS